VHPFPHVRNKTINVGVIFDKRENSVEPSFGVVQVPGTLPRLIRVPLEGYSRAFVSLEDMILRHLAMIFPQMQVVGRRKGKKGKRGKRGH
jgi:polyphosphate kinase